MRFQVKPHSGILSVFLPERRPSALAIGHLAAASLLLLPWHSFSPAALPSAGRGGERRGGKNAHPRWTRPPAAPRPRNPSCRLGPVTAPTGPLDDPPIP